MEKRTEERFPLSSGPDNAMLGMNVLRIVDLGVVE